MGANYADLHRSFMDCSVVGLAMRGQALPSGVVKAGSTDSDGDIFVARNGNSEAGKLNLAEGTMWNIWCHAGGATQVGEVLVLKPGSVVDWRHIRRGDPVPDGAVAVGTTSGDGPGLTYVARDKSGACGKMNTDNGNAYNIWIHGNKLPLFEGELLVVSPQGSTSTGGGYPAS